MKLIREVQQEDGAFMIYWWRIPLLRVRHISDREGERVYLSRYWLLGHSASWVALMVHKMHRPDDDACHHDHPWSFVTMVLRGGYEEEVSSYPDNADTFGDREMASRTTRINIPGTVRFNRATHTHRISRLPNGSCWTLVLRLPKQRSWGFHTLKGWVHWTRFIHDRRKLGVMWCDEDRPRVHPAPVAPGAVLPCITMPGTGVPPQLLAPSVRGLRYADETGIYITWIESHERHAARSYIRGQQRIGRRIVFVEVLNKAFRVTLQGLGFVECELPLHTNVGNDVATCMVWEPGAPDDAHARWLEQYK